MSGWEYQVVRVKEHNIESVLNEYAKGAWTLVQVLANQYGAPVTAVFVRDAR